MSENFEAPACQKNMKLLNGNNIVSIIGGSQWDNVDRITTLNFFIGQTCMKGASEDDERLHA